MKISPRCVFQSIGAHTHTVAPTHARRHTKKKEKRMDLSDGTFKGKTVGSVTRLVRFGMRLFHGLPLSGAEF